jgi:nickel-dependent lactate racemase
MRYKEVAVPYESVPAVLASNAAEEFVYREREIVRVPEKNLIAEIWPQEKEPLVDIVGAMLHAFENPVAGPSLSQLLDGGKTVAVITDNQFRATPTALFLPAILQLFREKKVQGGCILTGNGKVFAMDSVQLTDKLGPESLALVAELKMPVLQNEPFNDELYTLLGTTSRGTPAFVRTEALKQDIRIGIGLVQANPWGYGGGGPSLVVPGIANNTTIEVNHKMCLSEHTRVGNVRTNPVKQDKQEMAQMAGLTAVLNVLLNNRGEVVDFVFGSMVDAEKEAVRRYNEVYAFDMPELQENPADITICGTFALSNHIFFHTGWGMHNASYVTKKGGSIIYASPCPGIKGEHGHVPGLALLDTMKNYMPPAFPEYCNDETAIRADK